MNPITATIGGAPAVILSRGAAFACNHATFMFTSLELSRDGKDYNQPNSPAWVKSVTRMGIPIEFPAFRFSIGLPVIIGDDGAILAPADPGRMFPDESIERVAVVKVGDAVLVYPRTKGGTVSFRAQVTGVVDSKSFISVDYQPAIGDSGSTVTTEAGEFVGFVSTLGGGVVVPPLGSLIGTTPAPLPPQPVPPAAPAPSDAQLQAARSALKAAQVSVSAALVALG